MTDHTTAAQADNKEIRAGFELCYATDANDPANVSDLGHFTNGWRACIISQLRAPVADERAAFEAWNSMHGQYRRSDAYQRLDNGNYMEWPVEHGWRVWQARAALASAPVAGEAQAANITSRRLSGVLSMDGASLHIQPDGSGQISVAEGDFTLEDDRGEGPDGPQGSVHWVAHLPASEIAALRDFLTGHTRPSDDDLWDQTLKERDHYHDMADRLANAIGAYFGQDAGEHSSSHCPWHEALGIIGDAAPQASEAVPDLPRGWQLALNLAIDAIENAAPAGQDWPVNWPVILHGLKELRDSLAQPQASEAAAELPAPVNGEARAWSFAAPGPVAAEVRVQQLEAARIAYAREFPPDENGDPDVGNIHANIRKLKSQLAALSAQPEAQKTHPKQHNDGGA